MASVLHLFPGMMTHTTNGTKAMRAGRCEVCGAHVVAWRRIGVKTRLLKLLAMADHVRVLHGLR